ncbi:MAG: Uncharacterised protein [Flavobacteriaceae bacterium]|jgi:pyridoxal phosphate enzyme (YggS family)|nr:YggS family pyridoxal phosphate-dependent enzyme [Flavobacteriaceae bacterium]CAI8190720.1 MAG: Uncharacterised protein [Flavobacteriaceae bacterium]
MNVSVAIENFKKELPHNVTLIAVSKTKPISLIQEAYETGQRDFGENKVQELTEKQEALPSDIRWHMIGHLQRNKVKYIAPFVHLIHGVDSLRLLKEINKQGAKINRCIPILLQVHISQEDTKFGFDSDELKEAIIECNVLEWVKPCGLMGMATFTSDTDQVRREFQSLKGLFDEYLSDFGEHPTLSMGMSGDYQIAIDQGSTMIRIGSSLFGSR